MKSAILINLKLHNPKKSRGMKKFIDEKIKSLLKKFIEKNKKFVKKFVEKVY